MASPTLCWLMIGVYTRVYTRVQWLALGSGTTASHFQDCRPCAEVCSWRASLHLTYRSSVYEMKWKCSDLKCIRKPTSSRLSLTHLPVQPLSRVKSLDGPRVRVISPVGKEKVYGGKDLLKCQVLCTCGKCLRLRSAWSGSIQLPINSADIY